jgi:hypothetical protein
VSESDGDDDDVSLLEVAYAFPVTINATQIVSVALPTVDSGFFGVTYDTPNGNLPVTYANQILVFPGGPAIPPVTRPAGAGPAGTGGGAIVYPAQGTSFGSQPYVVAYSVGPYPITQGIPTYPDIAATAYLPTGVNETEATVFTSSTLGIQTAQSAFISWTYSLPAGVDPQANGAWIGLWPGTLVPYGVAPMAFAPVISSQSSGMSPMAGLMLSGNSQYVGALLTSGYDQDPTKLQLTAIAVVLLFTTGPPKAT